MSDPIDPDLPDEELDDTLRSLRSLIKDDHADDSGNDDHADDSGAPEHRSDDEDFPTLTNIVPDTDAAQRDLFEQAAPAAVSARDIVRSDEEPPLLIDEDPIDAVVAKNTQPETNDDAPAVEDDDVPLLDDELDDIDALAQGDQPVADSDDDEEVDAKTSESDAPDEDAEDEIPWPEDDIPSLTREIDPDQAFPEGVFPPPDAVAALSPDQDDDAPIGRGGFIPGSVDDRPYDSFGIDELPADEGNNPEPNHGPLIDTAPDVGDGTIWDARDARGFVRSADDVAADALGLVDDSLEAAGEKALDPELADEIRKSLSGLLGNWREAEDDASGSDDTPGVTED